jgi:hypothetical protein
MPVAHYFTHARREQWIVKIPALMATIRQARSGKGSDKQSSVCNFSNLLLLLAAPFGRDGWVHDVE